MPPKVASNMRAQRCCHDPESRAGALIEPRSPGSRRRSDAERIRSESAYGPRARCAEQNRQQSRAIFFAAA